MCFTVHPQFPSSLVTVRGLWARKMVEVIMRKDSNGVFMVMQSPFQKQQYKEASVPKDDVRSFNDSYYTLTYRPNPVNVDKPQNGIIQRGYHLYPSHRFVPPTLARFSYIIDGEEQLTVVHLLIPVSAHIPSGATLYVNLDDVEYVSSQIDLYLTYRSIVQAECITSNAVFTVHTTKLLSLAAHRLLYNRSAKWYDRKLKKYSLPSRI